jgi:hypothetical protein
MHQVDCFPNSAETEEMTSIISGDKSLLIRQEIFSMAASFKVMTKPEKVEHIAMLTTSEVFKPISLSLFTISSERSSKVTVVRNINYPRIVQKG